MTGRLWHAGKGGVVGDMGRGGDDVDSGGTVPSPAAPVGTVWRGQRDSFRRRLLRQVRTPGHQDGEDDQDGDRADVDEHLDQPGELGAEPQVEAGPGPGGAHTAGGSPDSASTGP